MKSVYQLLGLLMLLLALPVRSFSAKAVFSEIVGVGSDLDQAVAAAARYEPGQSLEPFRRLEEGVQQSSGNSGARKEIEIKLIKLLGTNATFEARRFACKQLGIIGSGAALPQLSILLQDPETTGIACLALTTYPPGKADELLRNSLQFLTGTARVQILNTLGDRRDVRAVQILSRQAGDADPDVAVAAISSLGKIGTPAAWKALEAIKAKAGQEAAGALTDAELRCADALLASGDKRSAARIYEELLAKSEIAAARRSALWALCRLDNDGGERRILEVLIGQDDALKPVAISRIASLPERNASEKFAAEMHQLRPADQALMIDSLAIRGDDAARLELAKSLSLPEPIVRRAAINALGRMGDPYFVSLLARTAGAATDPEEGRAVQAALISLKGGAETDAKLVLELKNSLPKARVALIAAIAQREGPGANSVLLEEADNADPAVAKAALRALARVGGPTNAAAVVAKVVTLRDAGVRDEAESTAAQLLMKDEDPARRSAVVLEALGRATTVENRSALVRLLPACGDASALEALIFASKDSEGQVRDTAIRTLADWPDDSAWDPLLVLYRQPDGEKVRRLALRGLVRLLGEQNAHPDAQLFGRYREVLALARTDAEFKLLLGVLSDVADQDALRLVLPLLSNTTVHSEAVVAAKKIADAIKAQHPEVSDEALKSLQGD